MDSPDSGRAFDQWTVEATEVVDFGLVDRLGRRVGAIVTRARATVCACPDGSSYDYITRLASEFAIGDVTLWATVQSARDGKPYGATMQPKLLGPAGQPSLDRCAVEVERRLAGMRKRYATRCTPEPRRTD